MTGVTALHFLHRRRDSITDFTGRLCRSVAVVLGDALVLLSFLAHARRSFRQNSFASATVELQPETAASPRPALTRSSGTRMYSSAVLLFVGSALALASYWAVTHRDCPGGPDGRAAARRGAILAQQPGLATTSIVGQVRYRLLPRVW